MNIIQKTKLSMFMVLWDFLSSNKTIVENLPGFTENGSILEGNINQIQATAELQQFKKTGVAESKRLLRASLIIQGEDTSRKMVAFATNTNNSVLLKEVQYSKSELIRASDSDLRAMVQGIYDRAHENIAQLATYGITEALLTSLLAAINMFNESIPKVRERTSTKRMYTVQLESLFSETEAALDRIDKIVEIVRLTQPEFYAGYQCSRIIVNTSKRTLALKGVVLDADSLEPLKGATLTITPTIGNVANASNNDVRIVKRTADKGGFMVKTLQNGMYSVTVAKNGYHDQVVTVPINNGELSSLSIKLSKN
ncbi:MAG: carboxypeptidase regulatory-like domain-containing protein [Bacteroidales bacterium]